MARCEFYGTEYLCDSVRGGPPPPLRDENPNVGSHGPPLGLALPAEGAGLRVEPR